MMPERIGIIGNTQGVKVSRMPAMKKENTISHRLPWLRMLLKRSCSLWPRVAVGAEAGSASAADFWEAGACPGVEVSLAAGSSGFSSRMSTDPLSRSTLRNLVIGG